MIKNRSLGLMAGLFLCLIFIGVYQLTDALRPSVIPITRRWGTSRLLVSDAVLYGFVRQLLAQSSRRQRPDSPTVFYDSPTQFYLTKVLFENTLRPGEMQAPPKNDWTFKELCVSYKLLTPADTSYMQLQMRFSGGFGLQQQFLPEYRIIPAVTFYQLKKRLNRDMEVVLDTLRIRYQVDGKSIAYLSAPLFSRDYETVIVEIGEYCGGICGGGEIWLLKRRGGIWEKVRLLDSWASF